MTELKDIRFILGEGLPAHTLEMLADKNFKFIPGRKRPGFVKLVVPNPIYANQKNIVQGTIIAEESTQLNLVSPGGVEDSIILKGKGLASFDLSFRPRQPGLFVYDIHVMDRTGNVYSEKVPMEVEEEKKLKILFLQKFPTAEVRYLKNYLTSGGPWPCSAISII